MLKNIKHIILGLSLIVSWGKSSVLEDIKYDPKTNGLMISIEYSEPIPDDNIIGWKSDRNWLYITLLGVKHINNISPKSCLLYTSPSPRDLSTSRMPSSA